MSSSKNSDKFSILDFFLRTYSELFKYCVGFTFFSLISYGIGFLIGPVYKEVAWHLLSKSFVLGVFLLGCVLWGYLIRFVLTRIFSN